MHNDVGLCELVTNMSPAASADQRGELNPCHPPAVRVAQALDRACPRKAFAKAGGALAAVGRQTRHIDQRLDFSGAGAGNRYDLAAVGMPNQNDRPGHRLHDACDIIGVGLEASGGFATAMTG